MNHNQHTNRKTRRLLSAVLSLFVDGKAVEVTPEATGAELYKAANVKKGLQLFHGAKLIPNNDDAQLMNLGISAEASIQTMQEPTFAQQLYKFAQDNIDCLESTENRGLQLLHQCAEQSNFEPCDEMLKLGSSAFSALYPFVDFYGEEIQIQIKSGMKTTLDLSSLPSSVTQLLIKGSDDEPKINKIIGMNLLSADIKLDYLDLHNQAIDDFGPIMELAKRIPSLTSINLFSNKLTSINLNLLTESNVRTLRVWRNEIKDVYYEPKQDQQTIKVELCIADNVLDGNENARRLKKIVDGSSSMCVDIEL